MIYFYLLTIESVAEDIVQSYQDNDLEEWRVGLNMYNDMVCSITSGRYKLTDEHNAMLQHIFVTYDIINTYLRSPLR